LVDPDRIQGLFFTGSSEAGVAINTKLASRPDILVSLEMSGVNPMILDLNVSSDEILDKYVDLVVESSFYTTGQRCVNGRHLYCVGNEAQLSLFRDKMTQRLNRMKFGAWNDADLTDVVAPLICVQAARKVEEQAGELLARGRVWGEQPKFAVDSAYVPPIVVEVGKDFPAGKNIFGPVLIVTLASDVNEAVALANRSKQVISAGIYSEDSDFIEKAMKVKAGLRRVNRATTGANGKMPFGGVGLAGNHRPVGSATTVHKF
jgi:succinylglutamic semialdehyde dehydrogenase